VGIVYRHNRSKFLGHPTISDRSYILPSVLFANQTLLFQIYPDLDSKSRPDLPCGMYVLFEFPLIVTNLHFIFLHELNIVIFALLNLRI